MVRARKQPLRSVGFATLVGGAIALSGCYRHHVVDPDAGPPDAAAPDASRPTPSLDPVRDLDLVVMVDDSSSMAGEQRALRLAMRTLLSRVLTGDVDEDGVPDRRAARSVRIGVVTSDMGVLGVGAIPAPLDPSVTTRSIASCGRSITTADFDPHEALYGDEGLFRLDVPEQATLADEGLACPARLDGYVRYSIPEDGVPDPARITELAERAGCILARGTGGCGLEMPLESVLRAVTRSDAPLRFAPGGELGHGPPRGEHADFFRPGAVLAILLLTDEDDCSTDDPEVFMFSSRETSLQDPEQAGLRFNTRCSYFADHLYPLRRYVDGFLDVTDRPGDLVFGAVVGVPPSGADGRPVEDLDTVLDAPEMAVRYLYHEGRDTNGDGHDDIRDLQSSLFMQPVCAGCFDTLTGEPAPTDDLVACDDDPTTVVEGAFPARRIVSVARDLEAAGAHAVVRSICDQDLGPAIAAFADRALAALDTP
jgi:hypothetical protein